MKIENLLGCVGSVFLASVLLWWMGVLLGQPMAIQLAREVLLAQ